MEFTYLSMCEGRGALFVYVRACVYMFIHAEVRGQSSCHLQGPSTLALQDLFWILMYVYTYMVHVWMLTEDQRGHWILPMPHSRKLEL